MAAFALNAFFGVLFIDVFGYAYHRWVEHGQALHWLGGSRLVRRISDRHAIHHNRIYPPSNLRPEGDYATEDKLSWYGPGLLVTVAVVALLPRSFSLPFAIGGWSYGLAIDLFHRLFHKRRHFLDRNRVFLKLQDIHDLHHVDQGRNFTILVPLLDLVGGSFRAPRARESR